MGILKITFTIFCRPFPSLYRIAGRKLLTIFIEYQFEVPTFEAEFFFIIINHGRKNREKILVSSNNMNF